MAFSSRFSVLGNFAWSVLCRSAAGGFLRGARVTACSWPAGCLRRGTAWRRNRCNSHRQRLSATFPSTKVSAFLRRAIIFPAQAACFVFCHRVCHANSSPDTACQTQRASHRHSQPQPATASNASNASNAIPSRTAQRHNENENNDSGFGY